MSGEAQSAERLLLKAASTLLAEERREDAQSFNLFTVLRSRSDEVNLHSRFLHALLGRRENLAAFLKLECLQLGNVASLNVDAAEVHREKAIEGERIDLWIADRPSRCAVAVENKINAGDQPNQLGGYYCALKRANFHDVRIIYLTLDGREPSSQSKRKVPDEHLSCVSYVDLLPWLETCQELASEDPALRSSIAQYRQLVREFTGGGLGAKQMQEMKEIIRESRSLDLARNLGAAANELLVDIVHEMWKQIDSAIKQEFEESNLRSSTPSATHHELIGEVFGFSNKKRGVRKSHGLYYRFTREESAHWLGPAPALGVEIDGGRGFYFGIRCLREDSDGATAEKEAYGTIQEAVGASLLAAEFGQDDNHLWWPSWSYVPDYGKLTDERLSRLSCPDEQKTVAEKIAKQLRQLWDLLQEDDRVRNLF